MGREQGGRYREQMKIGWEHGRGKPEGSREEESGEHGERRGAGKRRMIAGKRRGGQSGSREESRGAEMKK